MPVSGQVKQRGEGNIIGTCNWCKEGWWECLKACSSRLAIAIFLTGKSSYDYLQVQFFYFAIS